MLKAIMRVEIRAKAKARLAEGRMGIQVRIRARAKLC